MVNLKELSKIEERLTGGHRLCAGCGASIALRQILFALGETPVVVGCATGCLEVATTIYPYTAWRVPFIHTAFENVAATVSGIESAYRFLKKKGKIKKEIKFLAIGGDGGTYDIGLQSLSGMLERGHRIVYVCYDNQAYMNTGIQRSGATPQGASTTTSPAGKLRPGKLEQRKDLTAICVAHRIPYVAQATIYFWQDLINKAKKAFAQKGPAFLNVLAPCPRGWRFPSYKTVEIAKLAVETGIWPLYEVERGKLVLTYKLRKRKPIEEWLKSQGRYKHLFKPENERIIKSLQEEIDQMWRSLEEGRLF